MAKVFISSPIHANSQWELEKVIVVPRPRAKIRTVRMYGFISKGRGRTYIVGAWAQELTLTDLTRKWRSGSAENFGFSGWGSNPLFLRSWEDFNLRWSLYQSGP